MVWDKKMTEYERHAEELVEAMKERHAAELRGFQSNLLQKQQRPKFSRELLNLRRIQEHLAKQKARRRRRLVFRRRRLMFRRRRHGRALFSRQRRRSAGGRGVVNRPRAAAGEGVVSDRPTSGGVRAIGGPLEKERRGRAEPRARASVGRPAGGAQWLAVR